MKHLKSYVCILTMLLLITGMSITSCTEDFGPEIDRLKDDLSSLKTSVDKLKDAYEGGKIISGVEPLLTDIRGWKISFSDNSAITLQNGADGKDGITPYVKIDNNCNWIVSYDKGQTYSPIKDAEGNSITAKGINGEDGISVDIRVNNEGNYEIITYIEDKSNPITILPTPYSANPDNQISSIVEDSERGVVTITMSSGKQYNFGQALNYPTSIVLIKEEFIISEESGIAEIEFFVNPSNARITKDDIVINQIEKELLKSYAETYANPSPNYEIVSLENSLNDKGEQLQGRYKLRIKHIGESGLYGELCTLVISTKDAQDNKIEITSEKFMLISEIYSLTVQVNMPFPTKYYFENWSENRISAGVYDECFERLLNIENGETSDLYIWASGNMGYRITGKGINPSDYPTFKTTDSREGEYAACLVTRYVGKIGQGSPLAAGNLFIGEFSGKGINIMKEQMKATRFGMPIDKKPKELKFWFKYKGAGQINIYNAAGEIVGVRTTDNDNSGNNENIGNKDYAAVYAVMFDNKKAKELYNGKNYLDGSTILSSPAEVGRAILTDNDKYGTPTDEAGNPNKWIEKTLEFVYHQEIDETKLKNYEYSLAIVFSSSYYGAEFQGAEGSKLWIDEVELTYY